ncbi:unnamed protein product [Symbiodinium natans]|uniref:Uncharacterized protein n=1 Tax=Symbiodinium natans TaxID=878477 RepID=A0A812JU35_9DINO|nr:unnamed protein product [Symbiodinium natans]
MDSAYSWQSQQVGVPPHPLLLRSFLEYEKEGSGKTQPPVLVLGARDTHAKDPPVRDADLVAVCLLVRAMSRTASLPMVRLDLSGELISCGGARTIAAVLQVSSNLCSVLLRRTHVGDDGAAALGAALSSSILQELDLGECAVTDAGVRYLVRGMQVHGIPPSFKVLLLDGNAVGDAGAIEVIALVEEGSTLSTLSVHPALPRFLSKEVEAALQVACELSRVNLEYKGQPASLDMLASPRTQRCQTKPPPGVSISTSRTSSARHFSANSAAPKRVPDVRSSEHLASWMAATERELRELKWLLRSSSARLDGQHKKLVAELEKLQAQLDTWALGSSEPSEEARLDVLEARFDSIEQLVGREQSECAQMWQLVEVAAGAGCARK